ncbi:MAG: YggT family protein [Thermomicrobiales bacterium]
MDQLLSLIDIVVYALILLIIARSLFSWVDPAMQSQIGKLLRQLTEPIIAPIRQVVPSAGALDFSPMIAVFVLIIFQRVLHQAIA